MSDTTNPTNTPTTTGEHEAPQGAESAFQVPSGALAPPVSGAGTGLPFSFPSGQGAIEDVFLTPRVLDQSAFTRYSETLKTLIREASGSGESLQTNARSAHALVEESNAAGMHLRTKIEAGAKLVKMFDERITRSEKLLEEASRRTEQVRALDEGIDSRVTERLEALEQRLASVFDSFESKATQTEQRLVTAEQTALRHAQKLEELTAQLETRINTIEQRAADIIDRAEVAGSQINAQAETITSGLEARAAELARTGEPVERLCRKTLSALGLDPDGHAEGEEQAVHALLASSEQARTEASLAMERLGEIKGQADEARQLLGNSIIEASERIDALSEKATQARTQAGEGLELLRTARPEIEETVRVSKAQIEALRAEQNTIEQALNDTGRLAQETTLSLTQQKQELEGLLDASVQRLGSRVEEAGAWLGGLITRAAQTGQALERLVQTNPAQTEQAPTPQPTPQPAPTTPPTPASEAAAPPPPPAPTPTVMPTIPPAPSWAPAPAPSGSPAAPSAPEVGSDPAPSAWSRP